MMQSDQVPLQQQESSTQDLVDQLPQLNPEAKKAKKLFFTALITWLLALPISVFLQIVARFSLQDGDGADLIKLIVDVISFFLGLYGLLGWVLVIFAGQSWEKKKK